MKYLLLTLLTLPLMSCATLLARNDYGTSCTVFQPMTASRLDTPETIKEIADFNRRWEALCQ